MRMTKNATYLSGSLLAVAALIFLLLNISSGTLFRSIRIDLTQNKLYSLSPGTKEILSQINEPITLRFYFSKKVANSNPYLLSFASRVQDLLIQYERASKGKIILEVIDPEPFSAEEDNAVNYGLQGLAVNNNGTELYLGLVGTNSVDIKKVIPFLQPTREVNLEYDISQLIFNLAHPVSRTVGVISALPLSGRESRPWVIWQQMAQVFDLKTLALDVKEIPDSIATLMIVNPQNFSNDTLHAIDSFVMRGGHVLAFADPFTEVTDQQTAYLNSLHKDENADYRTLFKAWGVELKDNTVVADRSMAKSVILQQDGRQLNINYPFWMDFTAKNFDRQDVLTASLERVTIPTPGVLLRTDDATTTFSPLISTSMDAMLVDTQTLPQYQQNLDAFMQDYQASGEYVVAARISGPIKSAYSAAQSSDSNIIVIADADMLHDHFWVTIQQVMGNQFGVPTSGNGNFVINALDNLSGSNALISIRNRGSFMRPFDTIQEIQANSQQKYQASESLLQQRLETTKQKLGELENQKQNGNSLVLSMQQHKEEEAFRKELVNTRRELRDLRRKLNQDLEKVEFEVKFFGIGLIPLIIVFGGLLMWGLQIQREVRTRKAICSIPKL